MVLLFADLFAVFLQGAFDNPGLHLPAALAIARENGMTVSVAVAVEESLKK